MRNLVKMIAALMVVMGTIAGGSAVAAQDEGSEETIEVVAGNYYCTDSECAEGTTPLGGTVITSFTADGTELDSCTADDSAGQCVLLIPASEDGTYSLVPPSGYEDYVLQNETPQVEGQTGTGRTWTFVPGSPDVGDEGDDTAAEAEVGGEATAEADDDTASGDGDGETEASSLPSTGSGALAMTPASTVPFAIGAVLAMIVAAVVLRARRI